MNLIKAIIGALIGAAIGTVLLYWLRGGRVHGYEWFPLVTGLLTGLGARVLAGSKPGPKVMSYLTGAAAAVVAALAILMCDELVQMVKNRNVDLGPVAARQTDAANREPIMPKETTDPKVAAVDEADDAGDGENGATEDDSEGDDQPEDSADDEADDVEPASAAAVAKRNTPQINNQNGNAARLKKPMGWKQFAPFLFSGLGVLLAYQLGKSPAIRDEAGHQHEASADQDNA